MVDKMSLDYRSIQGGSSSPVNPSTGPTADRESIWRSNSPVSLRATNAPKDQDPIPREAERPTLRRNATMGESGEATDGQNPRSGGGNRKADGGSSGNNSPDDGEETIVRPRSGFAVSELQSTLKPTDTGKYKKLLLGLFTTLVESGAGDHIFDELYERVTGNSYEGQQIEKLMSQIVSAAARVISVNNEFMNQSIHVQAATKKRVGWAARAIGGVAKMFGFGSPADGVSDVTSSIANFASEPDANKQARSAQDWMARYYATLDTLLRYMFTSDNYKSVYGIRGTEIKYRQKFKDDMDLIASHLVQWSRMDRQITSAGMNWDGSPNARYRLGGSRSGPGRQSGGVAPVAIGEVGLSTPLGLQSKFRQAYRSEFSKTNEGKLNGIQYAEMVREMYEAATYNLLLAGMTSEWHALIPHIEPIDKNGRPSPGSPRR